MTKRSILKFLTLLAFTIFVSMFDSSILSAYAQTCGPDADKEIVDNIYAKIRANKTLASQESHINVSSANQVVKIVGWADNKDDRETVYKIAMGTACVKFVNAKEFNEAKPSEEELRSMCSGGTKPCGDICIPSNDTCNIGGGITKQDE